MLPLAPKLRCHQKATCNRTVSPSLSRQHAPFNLDVCLSVTEGRKKMSAGERFSYNGRCSTVSQCAALLVPLKTRRTSYWNSGLALTSSTCHVVVHTLAQWHMLVQQTIFKKKTGQVHQNNHLMYLNS